ncbi:MAG: phosphotransferase family protein [Acidimicrobiia bacterium]
MSYDNARIVVRDHFGHDAAATVERVGAGAWSECFAFQADDRDLVVRIGNHRDDFERDQLAAAWRSDTLPIPEVLEVGDIANTHFAISTRAFGTPIDDGSAEEWRALLPHVLAMFDAMRTIEPPGTGFGGLDQQGNAPHTTWAEFLTSFPDTPDLRTHGWRQIVDESPTLRATFDRGLGRLHDLAADLTPSRHVVHGDLLNRNVFTNQGRISGIFDWGCAMYADPLWDAAWLSFWNPWHPGLAHIDIVSAMRVHSEHAGHSIDDFDRRVHACMLRIGLDHIGYCAWTGQHADDLERIAAQVDTLTLHPTRAIRETSG